MPADEPTDPVVIPITGELDLHTFRPAEIASLLEDYFAECRRRGLRRVRVIHGKGMGTLRARSCAISALTRRCALVSWKGSAASRRSCSGKLRSP